MNVYSIIVIMMKRRLVNKLHKQVANVNNCAVSNEVLRQNYGTILRSICMNAALYIVLNDLKTHLFKRAYHI